jgi:phasin family protein
MRYAKNANDPHSSIINQPENAMFASLPTQMAAALNSQLASQLELWVSLNNKMHESVEKFVKLNMNAVKQSQVNASAASQQLLSAENATGSCWMSANHVQPGGNMLSYGYQAADIVWGMYAELAKLAQARVDENNRKMMECYEDMTRNTLDGAGR